MAFLIHALLHCTAMIGGEGSDRKKFALINDIAVAFTVGFVFLALWLFNNITGFANKGAEAGLESGSITIGFWATAGGIALGLGGGIACIVLAVFTFMYGVLSQLVLFIVSLVSVIKPSERNPRGANLFAMIVSLLSIIAAAVIMYVLINFVL